MAWAVICLRACVGWLAPHSTECR
eukprot:SAG25_NODE_14795_length_249_cov_397.540000_1_plen_23_part_01